ncbi:hypothetical protein ACJQWK_05175 [Exserohilum turcicum]|uniref:Uncharacterized protein n=1 Tax=Exserohilum turcicum (strain 28A) TaxID=671987 RepID=R0K1N9_EXST2|nr:uncharacterized protein SETTUDRAFT_165751 [Exserohilum turcica Et28A]EOA82347.1 hypothetical protein SETTUDRAFT_165751 [Exserohilum turcica Et28A]
MVSFTTLLTFAAGALASPVVQDAAMPIPSNWNWHVSKSEMGCVRGGCYYHFDVTVPSVEGKIAGVKAHCNGNENGYYRKGNWFAMCETLEGANNSVAAKFSERESDYSGGPGQILVSFQPDGT